MEILNIKKKVSRNAATPQRWLTTILFRGAFARDCEEILNIKKKVSRNVATTQRWLTTIPFRGAFARDCEEILNIKKKVSRHAATTQRWLTTILFRGAFAAWRDTRNFLVCPEIKVNRSTLNESNLLLKLNPVMVLERGISPESCAYFIKNSWPIDGVDSC
jgi:hypothetical protein